MKYKLERVKSTNIKAIGYEKESKTLNVFFSNNGLYTYSPVEEKTYNLFHSAQSIGKFFAGEIKPNKTYKFQKVTFKPEELDFGTEEIKNG